jgi:nucleoid-associated protein YgaU
MTSDAKIGLLLGLVFIFIIAFIINGLPKLRGETDSNELTNNMMKDTRVGIGWEGRSDEVINPPLQSVEQVVQSQTPSPQERQTAFDNSDVRHVQPVPGSGYSPLLGGVWDPQQGQLPLGPVRPVAENLVTPGPVESETTVIIRPLKLPKPKTYVVTSGDSLGSIAKKVYGPEEGNKRANIAKIFEANRKLLESLDEIKIGQELLIPPLPTKPETKDLLSGPLFKQVKSIGQKAGFTPVPEPAPAKSYTVKDGDSLWSISADQLGNGIRYKEIAKLNKDVLPNEDDMRVGTKLKIPAK